MRIALMLVLAVPLAAHAGVYKCVDSAGKATYSDKPCRGDESHTGMDVKGMTYSSDEVMYSNERAANILQSGREAQTIEEVPVATVQPSGNADEKAKARERRRGRDVAQQAERERKARDKAATAGIANGGTPWVPAAGGAIDPRTGEFKVDAAGGYVDPKTGKFIPVPGGK